MDNADMLINYIYWAPSTKKEATEEPPASAADIARGKALFTGKSRLKNGGPSCASCHAVGNDWIISGAVLATELTTYFKKSGAGDAARSVLQGPPHPVMKRAYSNRLPTEEEVTALVAFLKHSARDDHMPADTGLRLGITGVLGALLLLGLYTLLWRKRKSKCVNQSIYDRQVTSI